MMGVIMGGCRPDSPKVKTAVNGTESERWDHYPYGETWVPGVPGDQHRYTGHLRDAESENDYAGARYYANQRGRWLTVDPLLGDLSNPQRLNRYAYVLNNPINFIDPDGANSVLWWSFWNHYLSNFSITVLGTVSAASVTPSSIGIPTLLTGEGLAPPDDTIDQDWQINPQRLVTQAALEEAANTDRWLRSHSRCAGQMTALLSVLAPLLVKGGPGIATAGAMGALSSTLTQYGDGSTTAMDVATAANGLIASGFVNWLSNSAKQFPNLATAGGLVASGLLQGLFGTADAREGIPNEFTFTWNQVTQQSSNPVQSLAGLAGVVVGRWFPRYGNQILEDCGFSLQP